MLKDHLGKNLVKFYNYFKTPVVSDINAAIKYIVGNCYTQAYKQILSVSGHF